MPNRTNGKEDLMQTSGGSIVSPLTGGAATLFAQFGKADLIRLYHERHRIDVGRFFDGLESVDCYECADTGYRFFGSCDLSGDAAFYGALYSGSDDDGSSHRDGKWEHLHARALIPDTGTILDVGCGGGYFLTLFPEATTVGLETGGSGRAHALSRGLDVRDQTVEQHAAEGAAYDAITAFQVLEHIHDPKSFIEACIGLLKPGGRLILAVPNNDSFIRFVPDFILNLPPHHVGHWSPKSLSALPSFFPLDMLRIDYEPLDARSFDWYRSCLEHRYLPANRIARSLWHRLGGAARLNRFIAENHHDIHGPAVLAVYRKADA